MPDWRVLVRSRIDASTFEAADESALVDELAQHVEDRYAYLLARGWSEDRAVALALTELDPAPGSSPATV
jgi:hypothetical protein